MPPTRREERERAGTAEEVSLAISRELAALQKRYFGKGPESVRTVYRSDIVVVVLRGGATTHERTLQDDGQPGAVDEGRMAFQRAMAERFKTVVTEATGRRILAFMSGHHQDPEMSAEVFVLEPVEGAPADNGDAPSISPG